MAGSTLNTDSYNRIVSRWDEARSKLSGLERAYLDTLLADLPVPSAILDLGCGTGRPIAEHVLGRGHDVTGVDQASKLIALARMRFPQAAWVEQRIEDFRSPPRYAAVVCWDALFHIERAMHAAIFASIAESLQPAGKLMVTVGGSDHPAFTDFMFGEEFFYDSHPPETALVLLEQAGFDPLVAEFTDLPTGGRDKGRYAIVARKRSEPRSR